MAKNQATQPKKQSNGCSDPDLGRPLGLNGCSDPDLERPFGLTKAALDECNIGCESGIFGSGETDGNTGCSSCCVFCLPCAVLGDFLKMPFAIACAMKRLFCSKNVPQN
jgi:hypothetical protein